MKFLTVFSLSLSVLTLSGCSLLDQRPEMTPVHEQISANMAEPAIVEGVPGPANTERAPGSLWRPGANEFFKDTRAKQVGDLVTVTIKENAKAEFEANTDTSRAHLGQSGLSNLLNLEGLLGSRHILNPAGEAATNLLDSQSNRTFAGAAKTDRDDTFEASIAAMVTQVLPNGYLVIQGRRELRLNYEMQEIILQGIIRPADIEANNTISSDKIAEARISLAGKGIMDEAQRPQPAVRFMDKYIPF